jgi:dephospho-CoA kinase
LKKTRAFVVALTGGIGAGKSEALKAFGADGAATLSLDVLTHRLSSRGAPAYRRIVSAFGLFLLGPDREIDRKALGRLVFSDPSRRKRLESITHPLILREMRRWIRTAPGRVKIVDVPLLFEKNLESEFDASVCVTATLARRRLRVRRRDGLSLEEFSRRAAAQLSQRSRAARADIVLANDGSRVELRRKVKDYQRAFELISSAGGRNG